jgi:tol-pal system protein YbgF
MKALTKPVTSAGFFTALLLATSAAPQDYIDVEAERQVAQRAANQPSTLNSQSAGYTPGIQPYSGQTSPASPNPVNQPGPMVSNSMGTLVVQLQQLQEEVRRLNGVVEQQSAEISRLKEQSLERYVDLDRRIADLSKGGAVSMGAAAGAQGGVANTPTTGAVASEPPANMQPLQPGEEAAYQSAYGYVKTRNFAEAVEGFQKFLQNYPYGRYAPNAHYWLGELYLVIDPQELELARQSFQLLLDQYPNNAKIPDALYKLGKVHFLKGNSERSREYLDRVIAEYPGHPASQLATDFLSENF